MLVEVSVSVPVSGCLAAVELLHVARQSVDTSRWWAMRWPQNAVSLVGRAGALSPAKTCKLMRALCKHALNYLGQMWMFWRATGGMQRTTLS